MFVITVFKFLLLQWNRSNTTTFRTKAKWSSYQGNRVTGM